MSHKHNKRPTRAPHAIQAYQATNTCTTCSPPTIQLTRTCTTCYKSIKKEPHVHHLTSISRSVSHVTRSSPSDPLVQPLTVSSPNHPARATRHYKCTLWLHVHHVYHKHSKQPTRVQCVIQSYQATHTWTPCPPSIQLSHTCTMYHTSIPSDRACTTCPPSIQVSHTCTT